MYNAYPNQQRRPPKDMTGIVVGPWVYAMGEDGHLYARYFGFSTVWERREGGIERFEQMVDDGIENALANMTFVTFEQADELRAHYELTP